MSALEGMRVIELTQVMAGPFCGMLLADMGADVIKVEPPERLGDRAALDGASTAFHAVNRNKRTIALDLKDAGDRAALHAAGRATPTSCSRTTAPASPTRLGADYETLREINPRLIYASISGFGQTGPYAQRPGFDLIAQGDGGVMSVTGEPGGNPVKAASRSPTSRAGLFCAVGILSRASRARADRRGPAHRHLAVRGGAGAVGLGDGRAAGDRHVAAAARLGAPPDRAVPGAAHADGYITVGGNNQKLWERLCAAIGRAELVGRPALRDQRRPHGEPRRAGRGARGGARRARHRRMGGAR